jgi:hypothetical protein
MRHPFEGRARHSEEAYFSWARETNLELLPAPTASRDVVSDPRGERSQRFTCGGHKQRFTCGGHKQEQRLSG